MYLFLAILANVAIFAIFRLIPRLKAVTLHTIVVNYWVCVATGALYSLNNPNWNTISFSGPWVPWTLLLAVIFITTFMLMATTTQRISMTVATIATKMSLAIPVVFSLLFLGVQAKAYDGWNYLGIALAFPAIALASWSKPNAATAAETPLWRRLALPFSLFLMGGLIDSLVNFVNLNFVPNDFSPVFTVVLFAVTGILGILILVVRREVPSRRSVLAGIILGVPNYFSIFFVLRALADYNNDGALLYPLLNLGIILTSAVVGLLAFGERLTRTKIIGLALALLAITLLSYQELF